jgi:competence protein ComEA
MASEVPRQPPELEAHLKFMQTLSSRFLTLLALAVLFAGVTACNNNQNPDEIRQRTAQATETVRRDTKAVVDGVKEGMASDKTVNINRASREDLLNLPGITEREADRIVAERPFDNTYDLVTRHIVPQAEYDKVRDRIVAAR